MTFKISDGQLLNSEPNTGNNPARTTSTTGPNPTGVTTNPPLGNDITPTRQRELETLGNNRRSQFEGFPHNNGNGNGNGNAYGHRRHNSGPSPNFNPPSGSEGGLGLNLSGELLGLEVGARVRINNSQEGGPSLNFRNDVSPNFDGRSPTDIRTGVDLRSGSEIRSSVDVRIGVEARTGTDVRPGLDARPGTDVRPPADTRIGTEVRSGNDARHDFRHPHHQDGFRSDRSNNGHGPKHADHFLRDTINTLRHELNSLRVELNRGPDRRPLGLTERQVDRVLQIATRGFEDRLGHGERVDRIARQIRSDMSAVIRLDDHFSRLERVGGEPVRRAYESVLSFVLSRSESEINRLPWIPELLRDLRTGAFLHPRDIDAPFPLTGRARIVSEMMALMRTLEAIERFITETRAEPFTKFMGDWSLFSFGRVPGLIGAEAMEALAKALANSGPMLPGMAGRMEILRLVAALNGVMTDSTGRPLIMADGMPLKLGELLWFNARPAMLDLWAGDRLSNRLYPTLLQGFDAVYSLMGFDGRSLTLPHFIAIQSQINASEFEWFFGRETVKERWLRAAIEFLKDSISFDHNVLGEMLEEAVTNDRFHFAVMRGTVEDGTPVTGSFSFEPAPAG